MTEAPKPRRKRWRWIIAGVLLFAAFAGWWGRPRVDQRFVGKWSVQIIGAPPPSPGITYHFLSDGSRVFAQGTNQHPPAKWVVAGNRLITGRDVQFYPLTPIINSVAAALGSRRRVRADWSQIVAVGRDEITLRSDDGTQTWVLTRTSEE